MQRRNFLKASGGLAAGALTQPLLARGPMTAAKIKVGQIGTRHAHASGQLQTIKMLGDLYELVGVVEPDETRRKQLQEQPVYQGVDWLTEQQLLNTAGLQVVAVETEVRDLLATAQRCVDAGVNIHLDKPAGESLNDLERLHATAKRKSLRIQMGYMFRYNPAFQFLFQAVEQGWLGDVFEIHAVMSKTVNTATRTQLAQYRGGSMFELGCHLIDPLLHVMGTPDRVEAFNRQTLAHQDSLLDNTLAVFEFERATATVRSSLIEVAGGQRRQFVVCGNQGTIDIRPLEPPRLTLTLDRDRGGYQRGTRFVELPASQGRYHGAWQALGEAIRTDSPLPWSEKHDVMVQKAVLVASGYQDWESD